jgi:hypothetical protein
MKIPEFDNNKLLQLLLDQHWHRECQIILDYMPPHPGENTKPKVVVMFPNEHAHTFLRYSCGPVQCYFWDIYGDDMITVEIAILALSKAPIPLNYRKLESHINLKLKK